MLQKLNFFIAFIALSIICTFGFGYSHQKFTTNDSSVLIIKNADLIDGTGEPVKKGVDIIVQDGIFKKIGKELKVPENAEVIDATGMTIVPGIVGAHNHMHIPGNTFLGETGTKLYLASGVTTIQTCGSASPYQELDLSAAIERDEAKGPEIIPSAPYFTGPGGNPNMIIPRNEQHLRDTLDYWLDKGVKWIKVYRNTRPEDLRFIIEKAHKAGAKVRGHLCSVTFEEAAAMGIDVIEHGLNSASDFRTDKPYGKCAGGREYMDALEINSEEVKQLFQIMIDKGVSLNSTLAIYEASIPGRAMADKRSLALMSEDLKQQYEIRMQNYKNSPNEGRIREERLKRIMAFEYLYFKMGGNVTAGVDAGRHVLPGFGDQRNFELLIEAGFTTEDAIKIMTDNGARMLCRNDIGSVKEGKRADLVILNGKLKKDPSAIKRVEWVYKNGVGYKPEILLKNLMISME